MIATFHAGYFDEAVEDLAKVIETASTELDGIDFDTIVGTGFSGGIVIPALALSMKRRFVLIRKEDDDSHHGGGRLVGHLGERWIFVDDFISSGRTRRRVIGKIGDAMIDRGIATTTMVGQYMYQNLNGARFTAYDPDWR